MKRLVLGTALLVALVALGPSVSTQGDTVRITYLYDNTVAVEGTRPDWGFACLIEKGGHRVLFDTGANPDVLALNMRKLKIDPARVEAVVLSHEHGDHTVGVDALPTTPGLPVYMGEHFRLPPPAVNALQRIGARRIVVAAGRAVDVVPGVRVSEEISGKGAYEEALLVDSPSGLVVIVGCAHPGLVPMLRRISEAAGRPIHMVIGGFHLLQTPAGEIRQIIADVKATGVSSAGPTHCSGDDAMRLFREAFGDQFIPGGVGTVVEVPRAK